MLEENERKRPGRTGAAKIIAEAVKDRKLKKKELSPCIHNMLW
jgi:hypothetical protein